jgi:hypothetical protein
MNGTLTGAGVTNTTNATNIAIMQHIILTTGDIATTVMGMDMAITMDMEDITINGWSSLASSKTDTPISF